MQFSVSASATEVTIPVEATEEGELVEQTENQETIVIPEENTETDAENEEKTEEAEVVEETKTEETEQKEETEQTEGTENAEKTKETEETEEEEDTSKSSTEDEIIEKTTDEQLETLLQEATEEEDVEVLTDEGTDATTTEFKYAVQIYGIEVDQVYESEDDDGNVTTVTGGLTFGPAVGDNYTGVALAKKSSDTAGKTESVGYNSCEKAGVTKSGTTDKGNAYRCVHDDEWGSLSNKESIIYWNSEDPHVYDYCVTNGCTKTVPIILTTDNSETEPESGASTKVFISGSGQTLSGDGPGVLMDIIQDEALKYADIGDESLTWANSQVRAALNGAQDATDDTHGGQEYSESNSVLSAFPDYLRNAIGKKVVKYASNYSDLSSTATSYDKLWLFSVAELGAKTNGSTKYTGEGSAYTCLATSLGGEKANQLAYEVYMENDELVSWTGYWWTRTRIKNNVANACRITQSGSRGDVIVTEQKEGLAPGFVLEKSSTPEEPEEEGGYRYAVQLYGIEVDTVLSKDSSEAAEGKGYLGGLTFGPAIGADYTDTYMSCTKDGGSIKEGQTSDGNNYRCIHDDPWGESTTDNEYGYTENSILYWNARDPHVYDQCLTNGCTKAVELTLNTGDDGNAADQADSSKVFNTATAKKYTGDGVGALYNEVQKTSRHWGDYYPLGTDEELAIRISYFNQLNWSNSIIRSALNGYEYHQVIDGTQTKTTYGASYSSSNSILSAFPTALQSAIGQKAVQYALAWNDTANYGTSYDRLWLFSSREIYGDASSPYYYPFEGTQYAWPDQLGITPQTTTSMVYIESGKSEGTWLRSAMKNNMGRASLVFEGAQNHSWVDGQSLENAGYAIAPGFTLYRTGELPVEPEQTYKYAVQIYGICVDQVESETDTNGNVTTSRGGLTFGPAIGANYTATYKSHLEKDDQGTESAGTTTGHTFSDGTVIEGGHYKRCIHWDDWATIISWNELDPYVYEDCISNGCTKSIPLNLNGSNSSSSADDNYAFKTNDSYKVTGDGMGFMRNVLQNTGGYWGTGASNYSNMTWVNSQIRALLNGAQTETQDYGGTQYSSTNSILSAFPTELQKAIGKKAVRYATSYSNVNTTAEGTYATCYDQLWLLSNIEIYGESIKSRSNDYAYLNEGTQYARTIGIAADSNGAIAYDAGASNPTFYWTRSRARKSGNAGYDRSCNAGTRLDHGYVGSGTRYGVAPGFVLSRAGGEHTDVVQLPVTGGEGREDIYTTSIVLAAIAIAMGLLYYRKRTRCY